MPPVPSLLAEVQPLELTAVPVCMGGGVIGGPVALVILLLVRRPIARRANNRVVAGLVGSLVGAALGALAFNITFALVLLCTDRLGRQRDIFTDADIGRAIWEHVILFTVGGGLIGTGPGALAVVTAFHRDRSPPAPS